MKIIFTGEFDIPDSDVPDDVGSVDNWLGRFITAAVDEAAEQDNLFDTLKLKWSIAE